MRPIFDALTEKKFINQIQFHMPGHLRGRGFENFELLAKTDVTELHETDDLHSPEGVIKQSQERSAELFGAGQAYYLVNGSTAGVLSMVTGFVGDGEKIIADRFCHKSFVSALAISGAEAVWVYPSVAEGGTMWGSVRAEDVRRAVNENPDAKAVYITAPNYFGFMGDVKAIADIVHAAKMVLLVDGAHGAHYGMSRHLPPKIMSLGADAVCVSLHKTLPSLTQTAMLLTKERYERVEKALRTFQSSSPSYILLSSCEYAAEFYEKCPKECWDSTYEYVKKYFPEQFEINVPGVKYKDFTRLNCKVEGNPFEAAKLLREKYNISVECCYGEGIVAIANSFHKKEEFEALRAALDGLKLERHEPLRLAPIKCERAHSVRKAFFAKTRSVPLRDAAGCVSADGIMVYPPGVYQVLPGEVISPENVKILTELEKSGAEIPSVVKSNCLIFDK